jgi:hypothetical protein
MAPDKSCCTVSALYFTYLFFLSTPTILRPWAFAEVWLHAGLDLENFIGKQGGSSQTAHIWSNSKGA